MSVLLIALPFLSEQLITDLHEDYFTTTKEICNENGFEYEEHQIKT